MGAVWRDVRHAVRSLAGAPGFSLVALLVLMLSVGASTAMYSVIDAVILRGLPFDRADELVAVGELNIKEASPSSENLVAPQNFLDWRAQQDVFTGLAAINDVSISLKRQGQADPEILRAQMVTGDFFSVLRVAPLFGRAFTADDEVDARARVAVISYGLWQRRFGGSPDVLTRVLPGQLADFEILGVMPPSFAYPVGATEPTDVWVPYVARPEDRVRGNSFGYNLQVIGRLRDGVSMTAAQARMDQITAGLAAATPRWFTDRVAKVEPLRESLTRGVRRWMVLLLGAVTFVMLIACVNLANLMLLRATTRTREIGIRAALGASRWDLSRALFIESLVVSIAGAALGVFVAMIGVAALRSAMPAEVPRVGAIAVNLRVLATTGVAAIVTGLAFGLAPVWQFARPGATSALAQKDRGTTAGARTQWLRGTLVVTEVALAVVLLVGAGLFLASFGRVATVNLGLDRRDVLTARIRPLVGEKEYADAIAHNVERMQTVLEQVRAIPGVTMAALASGGLPMRGDLRTVDFTIRGRDLPRGTDIALNEVTPDYFAVLGIPLVKGRAFTDADRSGSEAVAILSEAAAKKYFPDSGGVGQIVRLDVERTVIGVVGSVRYDGPESNWRVQAFVPLAQKPVLGATLVLRSAPAFSTILPAIKAAIWSKFPDIPLPDIRTLEDYFAGLTAQRRFNMLLLGLFGLVGIAIAGIGIYGVMAYIVTERTQEIGIRLALGAVPAGILRAVLGRASMYLAAGLVFGLAGAWGLAGTVKGFLFDTPPHDFAVYAGVLAVLTIIGLTAAAVPARRAARVDPLGALRAD